MPRPETVSHTIDDHAATRTERKRVTRRVHRLGGISTIRAAIRGAEARRAPASASEPPWPRGPVALYVIFGFMARAASAVAPQCFGLCLFDKATRPRHRPRRTRLRSTCLPGYRGAARSGRARGYYAHGVRDVIRSQARVRVPICIPVLDISYTERRQVPRHWEERRAELGGPVHDPRLRATHRARATGTRMPVEDECHRRSW